MIDTDKYEGHTPAPWLYDLCYENGIIVAGEERITIVQSKDLEPTLANEFDNIPHDVAVANIHLIADAPKLLAEVKRLRGLLDEIDDVVYYNDEKAGLVLPVEKPNLELLRDIMMSYTDEAYQIRGDEESRLND